MIEIKKEYYDNGNIRCEQHYKWGKHHREDGPAVICYDKNGNIYSEIYAFNGELHRGDGPAYIEYYENRDVKYKEYWLNESEITEQEWFSQLSIENKLRFFLGCNND
jgi:antitoxin component YwqK of YwqJK toxin-antitoxin module